VIALIGLAMPSIAQAQLGPQIDGRYLYVGGETERVALRRALDQAAAQLNVFIRPAGRSALRRNLTVPSEVVLATTGDELAIAIHPFPPRRSKLDGTATRFRNSRSRNNVMRRSVQGTAIVETVVMGRITRQIRYSFGADRRRLTMAWQLAIPQYFSRPIRFALSYARR
jgi:hypothetical protein